MCTVLLIISLTVFTLFKPSSGSTAFACSPSGPIPTVSGVSSIQAGNATTIVQAGVSMNIPQQGLIVVLAVGITESGLRNLANSTIPESLTLPHDGVGHDHDSLGVLQQRGSWGTIPSRMDVAASATRFYTRLLAVKGWASMPLTVAAQAVQVSGTPNAYTKAGPLATSLAEQLAGVGGMCGAPVTANGKAAVAIAWAMKQLGSMYSFGGSCKDPFSTDRSLGCDCSSYTQQSWAAAGVSLPRTAEQQFKAANVHLIPGASPTNLTNVPIGSLLFYEMNVAVPGLPDHVALYVGGGKLAEASQTGAPLAIRKVYSSTWGGAGAVS